MRKYSALALILILLFVTGCGGNNVKADREDELEMLNNHFDEITTDIQNLNVTGHGDFANEMDSQIDFCRASISDINEDYGDEDPVFNICKDAWTKLAQVCEAAKAAVLNNDMAKVDEMKQYQQEYQNLYNQAQSQIDAE